MLAVFHTTTIMYGEMNIDYRYINVSQLASVKSAVLNNVQRR